MITTIMKISNFTEFKYPQFNKINDINDINVLNRFGEKVTLNMLQQLPTVSQNCNEDVLVVLNELHTIEYWYPYNTYIKFCR